MKIRYHHVQMDTMAAALGGGEANAEVKDLILKG
jgi:hypothetical protein